MSLSLASIKKQLVNQRESVIFICALTLAYGIDYLFNIVSGRLLGPDQFGVVVALAGVGQILVIGSRVLQTVTVRYVSRFEGEQDRQKTANFVRKALWLMLGFGIVLTILLELLAAPLATFLRIDDVRPVMALLSVVLLMAIRPIIGGTLQGEQKFSDLGILQIVQAIGRLLIGTTLIMMGFGAFGAVAALPLASLIAFFVGLWMIRHLLLQANNDPISLSLPDLFNYSAWTAAGLIGFALLINMDAILAKRFFDPTSAGQYGAAVTLGKVVQFFPVAIVMVLFPKAARRRSTNRNPAAVLPPAIGLITLVCIAVSIIYFLFQTQLLGILFGPEYQIDQPILGLIGLAMWLLSLLNVWLNYFLSIDQPHYVILIWVGVIAQSIAFSLWHSQLWQLPTIMLVNALWLTIAGVLMFARSNQLNKK